MHLCSRLVWDSGHGLAAVAACFDTCHALSDSPSHSSSSSFPEDGGWEDGEWRMGDGGWRLEDRGQSTDPDPTSAWGPADWAPCSHLNSREFYYCFIVGFPSIFPFTLAVSVAPWRWVFAVRLFSCPVSPAVPVPVPVPPDPVVRSCSCGPAVVCCAFIKRHLRLPLPLMMPLSQGSHLWGSYTGRKSVGRVYVGGFAKYCTWR